MAPRVTPLRELRPANKASSLLPTAAAIALVLAGIGCSTAAIDAVGPDPVSTPKQPSPAPSPSPSTSAPFIAPEPHDIEGGIGIVKPLATSSAVVARR
ncbi:MAG: hypothetical protein ACXWP4_25425 [Polyangiales bacterium]